MHSNKICAFFFMILCFAPLISADGSELRPDFHKTSCSNNKLEETVKAVIRTAALSNSRLHASLLRLHFHDCFVLGCDASLLLVGQQGEQFAGPNRNSILGLKVIDKIKAAIENKCGRLVSCADTLAVAAKASVQISLGKGQIDWNVSFGRLDGKGSSLDGANNEIPGPTESLTSIINKFKAKGLSLTHMVALSGAHTIGKARCFSFKKRLNKLPKDLQITCRKDDNNTVFLDKQTPTIFDNKYYENVVKNEAILESDQALTDRRTKEIVQRYISNQQYFFNDFAVAMEKMGKIGVITDKKKGEIRKNCGVPNKPTK